MSFSTATDTVRYEPDEPAPLPVMVGIGLQAALINVAPIVLTVVVVSRLGGQTESYINWSIFAALIISGATTALQAMRIGRVGSGHILTMGTSPAFIAVCVAALIRGGPDLMASLIVVSSLVQFALSARLSLLRRIITPMVAGTVTMLIAATVIPVIFGTMAEIPEDAPVFSAPLAAGLTLATLAALLIRGTPTMRLWAPIIAIALGCAVAAPLGLYDVHLVQEASWAGVPVHEWPGFHLSAGKDFWALLPAFIIVTIVGVAATIGDGIAIQQISRRKPRATDFRVVQGALYGDGIGSFLSGLLGTLPNSVHTTTVAEITRVASRQVGIVIGIAFCIVAFFPKFTALLVAIPAPIAGAYLTVLTGLLYLQGIQLLLRDGLDFRKATVIGIAYWVGAGFEHDLIFHDLLGDGFLSILLGNGMTVGTFAAAIMVSFIELTKPRRSHLQVAFDINTLEKLQTFLGAFASRLRWDDAPTERLLSAGEEALAVLEQEQSFDAAVGARRLNVNARFEDGAAEIEFVTALEGENMEDRLAYLGELPPAPDEHDVSYRLLWHYADDVRHQKYHGIDIVTVVVRAEQEPVRAPKGP